MDRVTRRVRVPRRAITGLRWAIGIGLVAVLLLRYNVGEVMRGLVGADLRIVAVAVVGLVAAHLIGALAWWLLAWRITGTRMERAATLRTYYVAQGMGGLTPANLGADAYRLYAGDAGSGGWRDRLGPIVVQRLTSSAALAVLGGAACVWLPAAAGLGWLAIAATAVLALASTLLLLLVLRPTLWRRVRGAGSLPLRHRRDLAVATGVGLVLGLAFHLAAIGLAFLMVTSIIPVGDPLAVLACLAIARLSLLVPVSPSGLGVQEGILSLLFVGIGLTPETALAAALLNRTGMIAMALIAALLLALPRAARRGRSVDSRPFMAG
jgi:glycosyltransferase 2 family protein